MNKSVVSNFSVVDGKTPNVTSVIPVNGSSYAMGVSIEVGANVSDGVAV